MELSENTIIQGKYRLTRMIGRGGMGSVWLATQLDLDRPCAIKFIEGEYATLPEAQERFKREAIAASKINSPYIVQVYEHGIWDGTPFIAMELLDGEDLGKRITRLGRVSAAETHTILSQVCRALGKAHQAGIVHRDLKPDNIFLVGDEEREIAKVVDFGIAKLGGNPLEGSKTRTGAMLGTPYYMSPEQAQGTKAIDPRSDLWSLAIITFQCITGKLPFESEALGDLLVKIIVSPIPVPSSMAPDVPPGFDLWFAKAASRDPRERFQTAKEFSEALGRALGLAPGSSTDPRTGMMSSAGMPATANPMNQANPLSQSSGGSTVAMASRPGFQTPLPNTPGAAYAQSSSGALPHAQSSGGALPYAQSAGFPHTNSGVTSVEDIARPPLKKPPIALFAGGGIAVLVIGAVIGVKALGGKSEPAHATETTEAKPVVTAASDIKPEEPKPVEAKPVEAKTPEVKPVESATATPETTPKVGGATAAATTKSTTSSGTKKTGGSKNVATKVDKFGF